MTSSQLSTYFGIWPSSVNRAKKKKNVSDIMLKKLEIKPLFISSWIYVIHVVTNMQFSTISSSSSSVMSANMLNFYEF